MRPPRTLNRTLNRTSAGVPRRSAWLRTGSVLAASALLLTGCSGDKLPGASEDPADPQGTGEQSTLSRINPLTGERLGAAPKRPILAFKIDNSGKGKQIGLSRADMVVEELVEGGITRLAAFYYSKVPHRAGPMRSMRATDIGIVQPLRAVLVASGGAGVTVRRVRQAGIKMVTEGAPGYYRGPGYAPYNLFMDVDRLVKPMKALSRTPAPYLPFGDKGLPKGKPAKRFTAVFSTSSSSSFELREGRYVNTDSNAAGGDDFVPDTVVVLRVEVGDAGYRDPAGYPVPETKFTGRGAAVVFHGGRMVRGTWVKNGYDAVPTLRTAAGPLEIPPGKVRIELVPRLGGDLRVG
jgi:hypothetical protein